MIRPVGMVWGRGIEVGVVVAEAEYGWSWGCRHKGAFLVWLRIFTTEMERVCERAHCERKSPRELR